MVKPIDWASITKRKGRERASDVVARQILQKNARHNLAWMGDTFPYDTRRKRFTVPPESKQDGIRAPASAAYGLAVLLQIGAYGEKIGRVSAKEARQRTAALIKGTAASYPASGSSKG